MKIALVHDWLLSPGGAEKVLEELATLFQAPIFTLFYDPKKLQMPFFTTQEIHTSFLQKIPFAKNSYRFLLPLFPYAIERMDLSFADVIISSSHAVAKGVKKREGQVHICYCHTPMRYAWDLKEQYLQTLPYLARKPASVLLEKMRCWDVQSASTVDLFIANSQFVASRILASYGKIANVIYPPVSTEHFFISENKDAYYITHSRLVPYKNIHLLIQAFARMQDKQLLIVGEGPERKKLEKLATPNVQFLGFVPQTLLSDLLSRARAYLFAAEEDFGIGVVEAQAAGLPVIAWRKGGVLETVIEGKTGIFFDALTPHSCIDAIERFEKIASLFDPTSIRNHALSYGQSRFQTAFLQAIQK